MGRFLRWALPLLPLGRKEGMAFVPQVFGDDGLDRMKYPLTFRFQLPGLLTVGRLGVVGAADALGRRVTEEAIDRGVGEGGTISRTVTLRIEEAGNSLLPSMLPVEFIEELPNRGFLRIGDELVIPPLVAEGRSATERLAELGPDRYREGDAFGNLLPLPLRHGGDHGVEEATGRGRGIDRFGQRNEVRIVLAEAISEFEEFLRVSGKSGEL